MTHLNWPELLPFGQALGWTLLHSIWQIAAVGFFLRLLLWFVPQKRSAIRYGVLLTGMLVPLFWAGITFSGEWSAVKTAENTILPVGGTSNSTAVFSPENGSHPKEGATPDNNYPAAVEKPSEITVWWHQQTDRIKADLNPYLLWLVIVWYLGVVLLSVFILAGFHQLYRLRNQNVSLPEPEWQERFLELTRKMGIRRKVGFLLSASIGEPVTFHFFRPVVLAPIGVFTGLSPQQVEILLLHELAHIRRYDFLVNIFQSVIEVLFFYHPTVWWISGKLREVREHCCDDLVLQVRDQPMLYAEALTHLQLFHRPRKTKLAMYANGKKGNFSKRILRLFGQYDRQTDPLRGSFIGLLLMIGLALQVFFVPTVNGENSEPLSKEVIQALIETEDQRQFDITEYEPVEEPLMLSYPEQLTQRLLDSLQVQLQDQEATSGNNDSPPMQLAEPDEYQETGLLIEDPSEVVDDCRGLIEAVEKGDVPLVKKMLAADSVDPNCAYLDHDPRTPLVLAARKGNLEIVKLLIAAKADVNFRASGDETPLMAAAGHGHLEVTQYLVSQRAEVNRKVSGDGTALLVAARGGHLPVVQYLVDQGAEVNAQVGGDGTPLICAARSGRYAVAKFLLEKGADPFQVSPGDEYAMYHARVNGDKKMIQLLRQYEDR